MEHRKTLFKSRIMSAPDRAGVYQFKRENGSMLYVGKARSLRNRLRSYLVGYGAEWKATSLLDASDVIEWVETSSELEALLLEARLIQSYQPPFNVLLKTGQPYLYFLITAESLPRFELVRVKKEKGQYFGPFIEKGAARKAFHFLEQTFALHLCGKKIPGGCLAYHMKRCAGICRNDFDEAAYRQRLALVAKALKSSPRTMLQELDNNIAAHNAALQFERSAQLTAYRTALERVYQSLEARFDRPTSLQKLADRDVWIWSEAESTEGLSYIFVFKERHGVLQKFRLFCEAEPQYNGELLTEYIKRYYTLYRPSPQILVSHSLEECVLVADFIAKWHELEGPVVLDAPARPEHQELLLLARTHITHELEKTLHIGRHLKQLLSLESIPRTIDCFDISHKQGHAMVGSCVRFVNGKPDVANIRYFHIKTLDGQNDYAALQEIVLRRYVDDRSLPDVMVIDGGKGQRNAVREVMEARLAYTDVQIWSLAKREETLFCDTFPEGKILDQKNIAAQMLIALRDYAHKQAVSFHRKIAQRDFLR